MPPALNALSDREVVLLLREVRHFESGGLSECPLIASLWRQYTGAAGIHKVSLADWVAQLRAQLNERAAEYFMRACHVPVLTVEKGANGRLIVSRRGHTVTVNPETIRGLRMEFDFNAYQTAAGVMQEAGLFTKDEWNYDLCREVMQIVDGQIP